jgi:hypothetical protein
MKQLAKDSIAAIMLRHVLLCLLSLTASRGWSQALTPVASQHIATLEVDISRPMNGLAIPASADLDAITFLPDSALALLQVQSNNKRLPVPFQINQDGRRTLHWMVGPQPGKKAVFELVKKTSDSDIAGAESIRGGVTEGDSIRAVADNGELTISNGNQHLLQYVYKTVYPPAGIDTAYKRSGFIHPLWSPHGQVLTRIQAPDHYHHYGVWDPWTHVLYKGDTVDFWNLKDRKGTVRFTRFASIVSGPVFAQYEALQEHVAFLSRQLQLPGTAAGLAGQFERPGEYVC